MPTQASGKRLHINTFSNIEHDAVIGNYCHVSTGASGANGNRKGGGRRHFLGSQAVMVNGVAWSGGRLCDCGRSDGAENIV